MDAGDKVDRSADDKSSAGQTRRCRSCVKSSKSGRQPATCNYGAAAVATMECRPGGVLGARALCSLLASVWSLGRPQTYQTQNCQYYLSKVSSLLPKSFQISSLSVILNVFAFLCYSFRTRDSTVESSLSANLPLVQLPLANSSCTPRVRALRLPQSFSRSLKKRCSSDNHVNCLKHSLFMRAHHLLRQACKPPLLVYLATP